MGKEIVERTTNAAATLTSVVITLLGCGRRTRTSSQRAIRAAPTATTSMRPWLLTMSTRLSAYFRVWLKLCLHSSAGSRPCLVLRAFPSLSRVKPYHGGRPAGVRSLLQNSREMADVDGLNAGYASAILEQYLENPESVPSEWR